MTFENEEGVNRALNYDEAVKNDEGLAHLKHWLDDHEIEIQPASEPSDIIWENRHFSPWDRKKKEMIVCSILTIMLFVSFIIIFIFTLKSNALVNKYPYILPEDCANLAATDA